MSEKNVGVIKEVKGPVVDIEFPGGKLPEAIKSARAMETFHGVARRRISSVACNVGPSDSSFPEAVFSAKILAFSSAIMTTGLIAIN